MEKMDAVENGQVTEDWQNMGDTKERLSYLAQHMDAIPTDVFFTAGPNKVKILAHKFMLGLGSSVFHSMFFGKLKENDGDIDIPDVDADAFQFFIRYFYTGQVDGMSMENVMRIMYCGKKYWVESLVDKCRLFIQENLSSDSACEVLHMADLLEEKTITALTTVFLARSALDVFQSPDWVLIQENTLVKVLQMADLDADEIRVYEAAKRWVEHASASLQTNEEKKQLASRIFKHVRMPLLTPSQIANGPAVDQILSPAELMDLYAFKFADKKPEIAYNAEPRTPRPDTFFVSFELLADIRTDTSILDEEEEEEDMNFGSRETFVTVQLGKVTVEVRADIVPATSKFFFRLCDDDLRFRIMYGDVEFERHGTTETKLGKLKVFPRENNLLRSMPGWLSFKLAKDGVNLSAKTVQVHPKGVKEQDMKGVVFGRVVDGMEAFENADGFRDRMWDPSGTHPMVDRLPSVTFHVCNVKTMLEGGEEGRVVALDEDDN